MKAQIAAGLALVGTALAQQSAYGQCGGANWTGATTCVSGYTCAYQNDYYSQCVPGTASAGTTTSTTKPATSTTLSTSTKPTTSSVKTSSSTTSTSSKATTTSSAAASGATGTFATTSGTEFVLNGETGYFAATNSYWISFLNYQADVDLVMSHLASSGIKVLRVWGFNDVNTLPASGTVYFQYLSANGSTINTGVDGLQSLDIVVNSAASHGIALIINFVNNWTDYGGMQAYVNAFGGSQTTWFTNTAAQAQYQKYIKAVVSRYANSSAIFAWELANEPRCTGCDESVIYNWAKTTSAYVKSLDSKHLVTLGDEGFFPSAGDGSYPYSLTAGGYSFADNLNISTLDFGTFHMYPTSWGVDSGQWALDWIAAHGAACVAANKPCFFEEYGYPTNHTIEIPWQQKSLATAGISGDAFWQDGDYLSWGATYDDGYAIYYNSTDWTNLVTNHVAAIDAAN